MPSKPVPSKPVPSPDLDYARRMKQEVECYKSVANVHELPEIAYFWLDRYVRPKLREVFGFSEVFDIYAEYILRFHTAHPDRCTEIASLGAGNADTETGVARLLLQRGFTNFRFQCLDINPDMLERGREMVAREQLADHFRFVPVDLAEWHPEQPLAVVIAQHTLHHMVKLEEIFDNVRQAIGDNGYFVTADMVGRNGHMRWPEALTIVQDIWRTMPDRYKYNHQLKRFEETYENWDCSQEGFEGIRAQDILPLLVDRFHFEGFVAFGNLPDIFVDRGFGHNFSAKNPEDTAFIDRIGAWNDRLINEGKIKPTQIVAALTNVATGPTRCHQHWTPDFCVRHPGSEPRL